MLTSCSQWLLNLRRWFLAPAPLAAAATLALTTSLPSQAEGLKLRPDAQPWPQWQARLGVVAPSKQGLQINPASPTSAPRAAALLGDYYFTGPGFDPKRVGGGLRATTGWLYGGSAALGLSQASRVSWLSPTVQPSLLSGNGRPIHAAYIGIGYTGLSLKHGWGVLADVGVLSAPALASSGLGDTDFSIRNDRLTPTVRLGMSYAF